MLANAATSVEQLHPACYAAYMLATSFGVPVRVAPWLVDRIMMVFFTVE